ncbi:hypothetical protein JST97_00170 [bacterium]|nr:hypothetical protein [bacterium]
MNIRNIADYLDQMHEGELDSSGHFTLDWTKALEKLGRYQSEAAGFWVVKFLQAAVASGARLLSIKQTSRATSLSFRPRLPAHEIVAALQTLEPSPLPALAHLQTGLQALSFVANCQNRLNVYIDEQPVAQYSIQQARLIGTPPDHYRSFPRLEFEREWDRPAGMIFGRESARVYADENLFLQEVGRFAPIEIRVDNRLLNDPVANKPPGLRLGVPVPTLATRPYPAIPFTLLERIVLTDQPDQERMALLDHSLRKPSRWFIAGRITKGNGSQAYVQEWEHQERVLEAGQLREHMRRNRAVFERFDSKIERADQATEIWSDYNQKLPAVTVRGYLSIDLCPGNSGRLYIVKDGVALKPRSLGPRFRGCLAIWSEPRVRTDLSQLQVIEDETYAEVVRCVTYHFEDSAKQILKNENRNRGFFARLMRGNSYKCVEWAENFLNQNSQ